VEGFLFCCPHSSFIFFFRFDDYDVPHIRLLGLSSGVLFDTVLFSVELLWMKEKLDMTLMGRCWRVMTRLMMIDGIGA